MGNITAKFNTNMGNFKVELYNDKAPLTVGNFMKLVDKGFYNGLIFHRVIPNFMIQTGCPHGTGYGGPGYTIQDEFKKDLKHDSKGVLSMANTGRPNTGGSQFFITVAPTPWLDGHHTIFGKVIEGYEIVETISKVQTDRNDKPLQDIIIGKVTIQR
jgi:peptidyl-prolyl cis-trans isomerase A (cyclophilin A)